MGDYTVPNTGFDEQGRLDPGLAGVNLLTEDVHRLNRARKQRPNIRFADFCSPRLKADLMT